jgi:hypothetical protein
LVGDRENAPCIGARLLHCIARESLEDSAGRFTCIEGATRQLVGRNVKGGFLPFPNAAKISLLALSTAEVSNFP